MLVSALRMARAQYNLLVHLVLQIVVISWRAEGLVEQGALLPTGLHLGCPFDLYPNKQGSF